MKGRTVKTNPFYLAAVAVMLSSPMAYADKVDFGNDSGEYPTDGECDDPRFTGEGMATAGLDQANIGKDASDCSKLYQADMIRLVRTKGESSIAECKTIDFGDDTSEWAKDAECDDPRFTGPGVDEILVPDDLMTDAQDCRALCESGEVWLK